MPTGALNSQSEGARGASTALGHRPPESKGGWGQGESRQDLPLICPIMASLLSKMGDRVVSGSPRHHPDTLLCLGEPGHTIKKHCLFSA